MVNSKKGDVWIKQVGDKIKLKRAMPIPAFSYSVTREMCAV